MRDGHEMDPLYVVLNLLNGPPAEIVRWVVNGVPSDQRLRVSVGLPLGHDGEGAEPGAVLSPHQDVGEALEELDPADRQRTRVVYGTDVYWGIERHFGPARLARYVTLVPDPVRALLSHYRTLRDRHDLGHPLNDHPWKQCLVGSDGRARSFREWFLCMDHQFPSITRNSATRRFLHRFLRDRTRPEDYTSEHVARCRDILSRFHQAGTCRTVDVQMDVLRRALGAERWPSQLEAENAGAHVGEFGELAEEIRQRSPMDLALYDHAAGLADRAASDDVDSRPQRHSHAPAKPVSSGRPLYVFLHTPKCAGTTFAYHIRTQLQPHEALALYLQQRNAYFDPATRLRHTLNTQEEIKERLSRLPLEDRARVRVVYGHDVFWGIDKWFPERSVRYVTFLRDPVNRLASWYRMFRRLIDVGRPLDPFGDCALCMWHEDGTVRPFPEWYRYVAEIDDHVAHNNMVKFLQRRFLGDPGRHNGRETELLAACKHALDCFHVVGTIESFDQHMEALCREIGLPGDPERRNNSPARTRLGDLGELAEHIRGRNQLDQTIYEYAASADPFAQPTDVRPQ